VARHCASKWQKNKQKENLDVESDILGKNPSMTMQRIWVAKATTAGGTSGSKQSILDTLINASKKTREGFISTDLALGDVQQNCSYSPEVPSPHIFPPTSSNPWLGLRDGIPACRS
jgi:hypothetical protein